jgi:hypothetical protein
LKSRHQIPFSSSLTFFTYPGKPIISTSLTKRNSDLIIRYLKRLRIIYPNINKDLGFGKHGIQITSPGRYSIFMKNNLVMYKTGNISALYDDPKRKIEKKIFKDISKKNYKEIIDFKEISKLI